VTTRSTTLIGGLAAGLGALALLLSSPAPVRSAEIATALGPVAIAATPRTVAVFDLAAIDTLDRLGVRISGLPAKLYVPELERLAKGATPVGTIFEPDLEALSALAPDLIILGGRSSPRVEAVRQVAPTIDMTILGNDLMTEAKQRLSAYGQLFGKTAEAEGVAKELDAAVAATRAAAAGKGTALVVMANGPKLSAYGTGSRFGWIHSELGLAPAVGTLNPAANHGEVISFEFIAKANPDWLIVLDRTAAIGESGANAKATLSNDLVAQTTAGRKGQIIYLPPADFYIAAGGASATLRVLERIKGALQSAS